MRYVCGLVSWSSNVNFGENTIAYPNIFDADLFFDGMPSTLTYCAGATIDSPQLASAIMVSPPLSTLGISD